MPQTATFELPPYERQTLIRQVQALAERLATVIRAGQMDEAREIVRRCALPPIAWGYLAARLQKNSVPTETVEFLLTR